MAGTGRTTKYCFDTSAFVESWRRHYPPDIFPSLWEELENMIASNRIIVSKEVEKELMNGNDELKEWFKTNNSCVKQYTSEQLELVRDIVGKFPKASDYNRTKPFHADPFVVALAKLEDAVVVTFEGNNGNPDNPRIPFVCKSYDVECCNMITFFQKEGLAFRL